MNIEVLIAKDCDTCFEVVDTGYLDEMSTDSSYVKLKASYLTIQQVKKLLSEGKVVKVPKEVEWPELRPSDLIVENLPPLELAKKIAVNDMNMHQNVLGVCVLDMMDYLDCYMSLMANGIFITDQNREDKYFEIIEAAQSIDEPAPLDDKPRWSLCRLKHLRRVIFAVGRTSLIKSVSFAPNGIDYFVVWVDCEKLLTNTVDMHGYR